jgi:dihydropteroate synthase
MTDPPAPAGLTATTPAPTRIGPTLFHWGSRTYVMGILNVTPDSFSGDGLVDSTDDPVEAAVRRGRRMAVEGADLLDVGGESTRPGHEPVTADEELRRVVPALTALRATLPGMPLSIDTTKAEVAEAALGAGADLINDVWGVGRDDSLARLAARRHVPMVIMHNRAEPGYDALLPEVIADLEVAIDRAVRLGVEPRDLIVDPGFGFGKTPEQNLEIVRRLAELRVLGRPILLGTSRKSTLGRVLDLPVGERLEATLATTALGIAGGADLIRVHDVLANIRAARISDAIVRANWQADPARGGPS